MRHWLVPGLIFVNHLTALLLLYYGAMQIPVAGLVLWALLPLPITVCSYRLGWSAGLLLFLAAGVVIHYLELLVGLKGELLGLGQMALIGLVLAGSSRASERPEIILGLPLLVAITAEGGIFWLRAWLAGQSLPAYLQQHLQDSLQVLASLLPADDITAQELPWAAWKPPELAQLLLQLTPALVVLNALAVVLFNYSLWQLLASQLDWGRPVLPLVLWEAPQWLIFLLIGAGFLWLWPHPATVFLGLNLLIILLAVYFLQGLAILAFGLQRLKVPAVFRWLCYLTLVVFKPAVLAVVVLGISDIWLDYRRLHRRPEGS